MINKTIKHYKIEKLLGKGGMGVVYLAHDTRLDRPIALKVLKADLTKDPNRLPRFLREARSAAAITHPAIAQVYDIDEADGITFIAMEYVEGQTVSQLIANRELDLAGSVEIALQVAEGLNKAHKTNIIHRDIKSDNIMVTRDGHAKLLDFGLAKLLKPDKSVTETQTAPDPKETETMFQTVAGTVIGTIAYMSPEQARGQGINPTSDIFSLGIVIYEMVTGEMPFKGDSPLDTMHSIAFEEVRPVTVIRKNLPPELHRIVSRCLRKRPENRYQDAGDLATDLKRLKHDIESGVQRSISPIHRIQELGNWLKTSVPFGPKSIATAAIILIIPALLIITKIHWANLLWLVILGLMIYRYIRNRKNRMLKRFVAKISKFPDVRAISIRENQITVIAEKAQAKLYIRVNSLIDSINNKLYIGKHLEVTVRDDLAPEEFQSILRESGIVYVRDDI